MLTRGIAHYVRTGRNLVFNENRLDRIWPDDFSVFRRRAWSYSTPEYLDVQRYGGILLVRPLLNEFGAPRALAYIAQTPLDIVENSVRISALRYQDQARNALRVRAAQAETVAPAVHGLRSLPGAALASGHIDESRFHQSVDQEKLVGHGVDGR